VQDPDGRQRLVQASRADASRPVILSGFAAPGFYRLERQGRELTLAMNLPESEVDLRYRQAGELSLATQVLPAYQAESWAEHQENLARVRHGKPLWPLLLCVAFLLAVSEELFANLRSRAVVLPEALRQFVRRGGRTG